MEASYLYMIAIFTYSYRTGAVLLYSLFNNVFYQKYVQDYTVKENVFITVPAFHQYLPKFSALQKMLMLIIPTFLDAFTEY